MAVWLVMDGALAKSAFHTLKPVVVVWMLGLGKPGEASALAASVEAPGNANVVRRCEFIETAEVGTPHALRATLE